MERQNDQDLGSSKLKIMKEIAQLTQQKFSAYFKQKFKKSFQSTKIYTVICSIGLIHKATNKIEIVGLANGTKSLPYLVYEQHDGNILKDMHAEILVIKIFRKFILQQIQKEKSEYFSFNLKKKKFVFNEEQYKIFLYSSQPFCGDCSVNQIDGLFSGGKPLKYFNCVKYQNQKFEKHILRTKPGRNDLPLNKRSLCLSCSDKLALYNILGIQGKYLFKDIYPVYIDYFIVNCQSLKKQVIQKGINFVYRLANLIQKSQETIKRKILRIVVEGKQRFISSQFKINSSRVFCIKDKQQNLIQIKKNSDNVEKDILINNKQGFQVTLLCNFPGNSQQWINSKTGLPEGSSLCNYKKKGKVSNFCKVKFLQSFYKCQNSVNFQESQEQLQKQTLSSFKAQNHIELFKYKAIKDRVKHLFGIWTDDFKKQEKQQQRRSFNNNEPKQNFTL